MLLFKNKIIGQNSLYLFIFSFKNKTLFSKKHGLFVIIDMIIISIVVHYRNSSTVQCN